MILKCISHFLSHFFPQKTKKNKTQEKNIFFNDIYDDINILKKYDFKNLCSQCILKDKCKGKFLCEKWKEDYNSEKKTFVIIDDNEGIISIIIDILFELEEEGHIDLTQWNIISFTSKHAGIFLLKSIFKNEFKSIDAALIDITFGNILRISNKNIKINGIHLAYFLEKYFKTDFYFYTGNQLNEYIRSQKALKDFFKKEFNEDIEKYIIHKNNAADRELKFLLTSLLKVDK
jgi:hypothetical protein